MNQYKTHVEIEDHADESDYVGMDEVEIVNYEELGQINDMMIEMLQIMREKK